jgi:hypothetical protein
MGAERSAGFRVQAALEQGAEDGRIDGPPIAVGGGPMEGGHIVCGQFRDVDGLKQAAVEPGNVVVAVLAAGFLLHGAKELADAVGGLGGIGTSVSENIG